MDAKVSKIILRVMMIVVSSLFLILLIVQRILHKYIYINNPKHLLIVVGTVAVYVGLAYLATKFINTIDGFIEDSSNLIAQTVIPVIFIIGALFVTIFLLLMTSEGEIFGSRTQNSRLYASFDRTAPDFISNSVFPDAISENASEVDYYYQHVHKGENYLLLETLLPIQEFEDEKAKLLEENPDKSLVNNGNGSEELRIKGYRNSRSYYETVIFYNAIHKIVYIFADAGHDADWDDLSNEKLRNYLDLFDISLNT